MVAIGYLVALVPPFWQRDAGLVLIALLLSSGLICSVPG